MMTHIQGTTLKYFIYMCIVQAISVSTTTLTTIDHHIFMVSFWRHRAEDILNKYAPLLQACCSVFPRKLPEDLLNRDGELTVVLIFDICNVHEIVAYDWLHSQHWGGGGGVKMLNMASKLLWNIEDWCLFFVG